MLQKQVKQVKNRGTKTISIGIKDNFHEQECIILSINEFEQLKQNSNNDTEIQKQVITLSSRCEYLEKTITDKEQDIKNLQDTNKELTQKIDKLYNKIDAIKNTFLNELLIKNNEINHILSELKSLSKIELLFNKHKQIIRNYENNTKKEQIKSMDNNFLN